MKNAFLNDGEVVVAIDNLHDHSNGATSIAIIWDGESLREENYANAYNNGSFDDAEVNCTPSEKEAAVQWYIDNKEDIKMIGNKASYLGCTVILARSRKAPNRIPLLVSDFSEGGYNERFRCHEDCKIEVSTESGAVWVSTGTIKEVSQYAKPWWA